jgi:hypothetical protein
LNSVVFALSASSPSAEIAGSSALIWRTAAPYCLSSRSLRLPKMRVRILIIVIADIGAGAKNKG